MCSDCGIAFFEAVLCVDVLFVIYGERLFSRITERSEMGIYEMPMSLLGFLLSIMCGMMLFNAMLLVRYVSPRGVVFIRCLVFHL